MACKEKKERIIEKSSGLSLALIFVLWTVAVPWGEAIWVDLTPQQLQEAIQWGQENLKERRQKGLPVDKLEEEWAVELGEGKGRAYLHTLFERVSFQARHYAAIRMELPQREIDNIFVLTKGKLVFELTLYGGEHRFAEKYRVRLLAGEETVDPRDVDVFKGMPSGLEDPELAFKATYIARFPLEGIEPQSQVTVVAIGPKGQEVRFPFDLSKMR